MWQERMHQCIQQNGKCFEKVSAGDKNVINKQRLKFVSNEVNF